MALTAEEVLIDGRRPIDATFDPTLLNGAEMDAIFKLLGESRAGQSDPVVSRLFLEIETHLHAEDPCEFTEPQ